MTWKQNASTIIIEVGQILQVALIKYDHKVTIVIIASIHALSMHNTTGSLKYKKSNILHAIWVHDFCNKIHFICSTI